MDIAKLPPSSAIPTLFLFLLAVGFIAELFRTKRDSGIEKEWARDIDNLVVGVTLILSLLILFTEKSWWSAVLFPGTALVTVIRKKIGASLVYLVATLILVVWVVYFKFCS